MMRRKAQIIVFVGDRGTGKSTLAIRLWKLRGYPAIVLDKMNQPNYTDMAELLHDSTELLTWKRQKSFRVYDEDALDNIFKMLKQTAYEDEKSRQTTGLLILEDAGNYTAANVKLNFIELCTSCRHSNIDIFLMFHSLADVPTKLYQYLDKVVLFKTKSTPEQIRKLGKLTNPSEVKKAFTFVQNANDPHANIVIGVE